MTEYPAAPASAILAVLALSQAWPRGKAARWRVIAGVGVGAGICVVVLLGYLHAAFGTFRPSYSYYDPNSFSFMQQQGYMGLTYPHPDRLLKILFGCSRGLFFASPVLVAAPRWIVVDVEGESASRGGAGGGRDRCRITFCSMRRFTGGRRGCRSVRDTRGRAFHCYVWVAGSCGGGLRRLWRRVLIVLAFVQCGYGADGGFDDVAIVDAGSLSARAFGLAGVLVGTGGAESRFDVDGRGSGSRGIMERSILVSWSGCMGSRV